MFISIGQKIINLDQVVSVDLDAIYGASYSFWPENSVEPINYSKNFNAVRIQLKLDEDCSLFFFGSDAEALREFFNQVDNAWPVAHESEGWKVIADWQKECQSGSAEIAGGSK